MTVRSPVPIRRRPGSSIRGSWRRASRATLGGLCRVNAGRRLCGFNRLYEANRKAGAIVEAACWAHGRRKFFDLVRRLSKAPIAAEAVKRIDVLFAIEREINGHMPQERLRVRQERSRPLVIELQTWAARPALQEQRHDQSNQLQPQPLGPSPASSTMDASASRTTRPNASCEPWPWAERTAPLLAPTKAAGAPLQSTR
jgi:hypothetical protein